MRNILVTAAVAIMLGSTGLAMAASTTAPAAAVTKPVAVAAATTPQSITDTVKAFDLSKHMLTLSNGISYVLPATFKDPGLKVGSKVTVKWQMNGKAYDAQSVTIG